MPTPLSVTRTRISLLFFGFMSRRISTVSAVLSVFYSVAYDVQPYLLQHFAVAVIVKLAKLRDYLLVLCAPLAL